MNGFNGAYQLKSDRYVIDAKSILGIFSLDLSKPVTLVMNDKEEFDSVMNAISEYILD